jgi:hypothetical protein
MVQHQLKAGDSVKLRGRHLSTQADRLVNNQRPIAPLDAHLIQLAEHPVGERLARVLTDDNVDAILPGQALQS